jgi:2-methylfumaryl-CoA isomerase
MYDLLKGLRIVEGASFIAAPSGGLHLLRLGAEVIRFDAIGGGPDFRRWPKSPGGASLYWESLNKGKKSIAINLTQPEGRELAIRLATAPGPNGGIFLTNYPVDGFLAHERLAKLRADLITVRVMGWADGAQAMDYTINAATGIPLMTGPPSLGEQPVNHVLPAWDLITGAYVATAVLAAERHRRETGRGQEVRVPLSDVAITALGDLGQIAEVTVTGDRPRMGNDLYGGFGRDFLTADRQRIMIVALTAKQWISLVRALGIDDAASALEREVGVALFAHDEGARFTHRERLFALVQPAIARRTLAELAQEFDRLEVTWAPYRTVAQAIAQDPRLVTGNPIFAPVAHPSGHTYPTPGAPMQFTGHERGTPPRAPHLGEHTDQVLAELLGLSAHEIGTLHDRGLVAGPK